VFGVQDVVAVKAVAVILVHNQPVPEATTAEAHQKPADGATHDTLAVLALNGVITGEAHSYVAETVVVRLIPVHGVVAAPKVVAGKGYPFAVPAASAPQNPPALYAVAATKT